MVGDGERYGRTMAANLALPIRLNKKQARELKGAMELIWRGTLVFHLTMLQSLLSANTMTVIIRVRVWQVVNEIPLGVRLCVQMLEV